MSSSEYFIHPTSIVGKKAKIGKGSKIWHFSHVMDGATLGENCSLGQNVFIAGDVKIGNGVKIQNNVSLYSGVTLEDDVFCGPSCVFTNVKNPRSHVSRKNEYMVTRVGKGATIGANATIVCGKEIGRFCFIGAGSCVTKSVPDNALVYGVPAKVTGWVCDCGEVLKFKSDKAICMRCKTKYRKNKQGINKSR